jgi:hypothetical protein
MAYTYAPHQPEIYDGKMFMVTPDTGEPFLVSTATGESEVPALVEHHLNPPTPAPYPPPGPPPPDPLVEAQRANARIDAGVLAALDVAVAVKGAMTALPDNFTAANFIAVKIQLDALTELVASMLQAQVSIPPPGAKPP